MNKFQTSSREKSCKSTMNKKITGKKMASAQNNRKLKQN